MRWGVYALPGDDVYACVTVNQDIENRAPVRLMPGTYAGDWAWADLNTMQPIASEGETLLLILDAGEGKVIWYGPTRRRQAVIDGVAEARARWRLPVLRDDCEVMSHYGLTPASLDALVDVAEGRGDVSWPGQQLNQLSQQLSQEMAQLAHGTLFQRAQDMLSECRDKIKAVAAQAPLTPRHGSDYARPENFTAHELALAKAVGVWYDATLAHIEQGLTRNEIDTYLQTIERALREATAAMPK